MSRVGGAGLDQGVELQKICPQTPLIRLQHGEVSHVGGAGLDQGVELQETWPQTPLIRLQHGEVSRVGGAGRDQGFGATRDMPSAADDPTTTWRGESRSGAEVALCWDRQRQN